MVLLAGEGILVNVSCHYLLDAGWRGWVLSANADGEARVVLRRELSAQKVDNEAELFDQRLREREARRKAQNGRPFFDIEPTRQYERES